VSSRRFALDFVAAMDALCTRRGLLVIAWTCLSPKSDRGVGRRYERRDHALPTFVLTADPDGDLATNQLMPWNIRLRIALR
jgi:hypothetical protein